MLHLVIYYNSSVANSNYGFKHISQIIHSAKITITRGTSLFLFVDFRLWLAVKCKYNNVMSLFLDTSKWFLKYLEQSFKHVWYCRVEQTIAIGWWCMVFVVLFPGLCSWHCMHLTSLLRASFPRSFHALAFRAGFWIRPKVQIMDFMMKLVVWCFKIILLRFVCTLKVGQR